MDFDDYFILSDIMEDLTGMTLEEAEGDHSGTYFSREHWVDGDGIARALIEAYRRGGGE